MPICHSRARGERDNICYGFTSSYGERLKDLVLTPDVDCLQKKYTVSLASDDSLPLTDSQRRAVDSLNVKELLHVHEPLSRQFGVIKSDIHGCVEGATGDDLTVTNALSEVAYAFQQFVSGFYTRYLTSWTLNLSSG